MLLCLELWAADLAQGAWGWPGQSCSVRAGSGSHHQAAFLDTGSRFPAPLWPSHPKEAGSPCHEGSPRQCWMRKSRVHPFRLFGERVPSAQRKGMGAEQLRSWNAMIWKGPVSHNLPEIEANSILQPCSSSSHYQQQSEGLLPFLPVKEH